MAGVRAPPPYIESRRPLPAIDKLLANRTLVSAEAYRRARPLRRARPSLAPRLDPAAYLSAHWHHDRCGKRLKVFVFPHHVTEETKPTLIVPGTHRTWYYAEVAPVDVVSRFAPQYVHHVAASRGTRVTPLTGRAGGGFIFDTNALHRAHGGNRSRTVVVLEFHAHGKVGGLRGHIDGPCPSTPRVLFDRPMEFERRRPAGPPALPDRGRGELGQPRAVLRGTTNFLAGVCGVSADSSDCARGAYACARGAPDAHRPGLRRKVPRLRALQLHLLLDVAVARRVLVVPHL